MSISVKRPEGSVDFCTDLALVDAWTAAAVHLEEVCGDDTDQRLGDPAVGEAAAEVQRLEAEMKSATLRFRTRALGRRRWQELLEEHPPREDNKQDAAMSANVSTFFDAVAAESIFEVIDLSSGERLDFDPESEWLPLANEMTDGQYQAFVDEFLLENRGVTGAPFSQTASALTRFYEKNSNSQNESESATGD
jgi:hypothetical protein